MRLAKNKKNKSSKNENTMSDLLSSPFSHKMANVLVAGESELQTLDKRE